MLSPRLFGRHIRDRPHDQAWGRVGQLRKPLCRGTFCKAKIKYLYQTIIPDYDVLGFYITVNDTGSVSRAEPCEYLPGDIQTFLDRRRAFAYEMSYGLSMDVFRRDEC